MKLIFIRVGRTPKDLHLGKHLGIINSINQSKKYILFKSIKILEIIRVSIRKRLKKYSKTSLSILVSQV